MSIHVLIADDHTLVRSGLRALLDRTTDIRVIAEASDGREALALIKTHQPDIVIMDVAMAGLNGLETLPRILRDHCAVRVIVLSMHKNEEYVVHALRAGAVGYVLKDAAASELEQAIRAVMRGDMYLSPEASQRVADYEERVGIISNSHQAEGNTHAELTLREREVLQLIVEGRTMQEIASMLFISVKTVETHRYRLMDRLNIHHVTGLVRYAMRTGMLQ